METNLLTHWVDLFVLWYKTVAWYSFWATQKKQSVVHDLSQSHAVVFVHFVNVKFAVGFGMKDLIYSNGVFNATIRSVKRQWWELSEFLGKKWKKIDWCSFLFGIPKIFYKNSPMMRLKKNRNPNRHQPSTSLYTALRLTSIVYKRSKKQ